MSINPYVEIDIEYSDRVHVAVVEHERTVSGANAQLALLLAATDDPAERAAIIEEFDRLIQPARDAFHDAVQAAEDERDFKKATVEAAYLKHTDDLIMGGGS